MPYGRYTALEQPVMTTKITVPRTAPGAIRRPRLTERVNRGIQGPLTLVTAPAGFGKTNVLVQWANETDQPRAWLSLDGEDNDPRRLFRHMIGALRTLEPGLGDEALDFILSTRGGGLEVGLTLLINEVSALPRDLVLILDEFQSLHDQVTLQGIDFIIKHLPYNLHLVIASRSALPLNLATLRVRSSVYELGAGDLRFTEEEIARFFDQTLGLQLSPETVRTIEIRTDGWVAGLQMAAISLRDDPDPEALLVHLEGGAHAIVDFLAAEVLDRQPAEVRQFLLRSSVLELLTGPLCEAVVNPSAQPGYGAVMLDRLERANLFILPVDERHEWFRYHRLFVDVLRHVEREVNPAEIPVLHKRAATWFEEHGNLDEALRHALASGDLEWMADMLERNTAWMIGTGEVPMLTRWVDELPDAIIHQRPQLGLAYAWGAIAGYRLDLARYWLDDLQRTLDHPEAQPGADADGSAQPALNDSRDTGLWNTRGGVAVCQSMLALLSGDIERAAQLFRQAAGYLQEQNPFIRSFIALDESLYFVFCGDTERAIESLRNTARLAMQANNLLVMIIAVCETAELQALQGQLSKAWASLERVQYMALGPDGNPLPLAALADIGFSAILLERDSLQEAHECLERGRRQARSLWPLSNLDGMVTQAQLYHARGDYRRSQAMLEEASRLALSTDSSQWDDIIISAVTVRLALQRGDLSEATLAWGKAGFPDVAGSIPLEEYPYAVYEYLALTQAQFLLVRGQDAGSKVDLLQASRLLGLLLPEANRLYRVTSQIEVLVLQAMMQAALDDQQATATLLRALALGEPEGYRRVFLEHGWRLRPLLELCASHQAEGEGYLPSMGFIESLVETIDRRYSASHDRGRQADRRSSASTHAGAERMPDPLSVREIEVLSLIAEGKSNQEIASQLFLALNTVKRHAYNIYAKLDVKKRTQAVSKARALKLIQ